MGNRTMPRLFDYARQQVGRRSVAKSDNRSYRLTDIASSDVLRQMKIADDTTGTPSNLSGIWWMDGNPLPDEAASFGGATVNRDQRTILLPVYEDGIWTWHPNVAGRALYAFVNACRMTYEFRFNATFDAADITPIFTIGNNTLRIPASVARFTLRYVRDGLWIRENWRDNRLIGTYTLRRIGSADGKPTEAFNDYLAAAPSRLLLARQVR
jgi:hypothetical protein